MLNYYRYDLNNDGIIDEIDYQIVVNIALSEDNTNMYADIDGDGVVDVIDCALFQRYLHS